MVLNNFIETFMYQGVFGTNIRGEQAYGKSLYGNPLDNYGQLQLNYFMSALPTDNMGPGNVGVFIGSNDTPVTPDDYAWNNNIDTLTKVSQSAKIVTKNGNKVLRFILSVTNDTDADVEVKEVGVIVSVNYGRNANALIAREVLDTPITVKANGGAQIFGIDIG